MHASLETLVYPAEQLCAWWRQWRWSWRNGIRRCSAWLWTWAARLRAPRPHQQIEAAALHRLFEHPKARLLVQIEDAGQMILGRCAHLSRFTFERLQRVERLLQFSVIHPVLVRQSLEIPQHPHALLLRLPAHVL